MKIATSASFRVPSPREVPWRDLTRIGRFETLIELCHPLPWLAAELALAQIGWYGLAVPCTFWFFLTALRLNHEAIHGNLGLSRRADGWVLHGLSAVMLGSNHVVGFNHLHHHAHLLGPDDHEGKCGNLSFWQVLAYGPRFPVDLHQLAWRTGGPSLRRRMIVDGGLNLAVVALAIGCWPSPALAYHVAMMVAAQAMTAFFAVWITHHGCQDRPLKARTQRSPLINFFSYNMFFHLEHHLFPMVPVSRLPQLAARLDGIQPELPRTALRVMPEFRPRSASRAS